MAKKGRRRIIQAACALLTAVAVLLSSCAGNKVSYKNALEDIHSFLSKKGGLKRGEELLDASWYRAGDSLTDWIVISELRAGRELDTDQYLRDLKAYVTKSYAREEKLDRVKATEWHRIALAVQAAGGDPTCFGEDPAGDPINLIADGVYNWRQTDSLDDQGSNALIFALHVLRATNCNVPDDALYTKERLIGMLLSYQQEDGGFSLAASGSDTDITAMALQALAPNREPEQEYVARGSSVTVAQSVDKAIDYLSEQQRAGGYYIFGDHYSSDTLSQVIMALCASGIDPESDERFKKSGASAAEALLSFRNSDGGFASSLEGGKPEESDMLATQQASGALTAILLLQKGDGDYYGFSNTI